MLRAIVVKLPTLYFKHISKLIYKYVDKAKYFVLDRKVYWSLLPPDRIQRHSTRLQGYSTFL